MKVALIDIPMNRKVAGHEVYIEPESGIMRL